MVMITLQVALPFTGVHIHLDVEKKCEGKAWVDHTLLH